MSTQLTIPTQKPIIPKPTKTEIISAMVEIAREKFEKEQEVHQAALDAFDATLQKHARKLLRKHISTATIDVDVGYDGNKISIRISSVPHELGERNLYNERERLRRPTYQSFDEKRTRDSIRDRMNRGTPTKEERIDALLDDPAARRHLELALEALYAPEEPEAIEV